MIYSTLLLMGEGTLGAWASLVYPAPSYLEASREKSAHSVLRHLSVSLAITSGLSTTGQFSRASSIRPDLHTSVLHVAQLMITSNSIAISTLRLVFDPRQELASEPPSRVTGLLPGMDGSQSRSPLSHPRW